MDEYRSSFVLVVDDNKYVIGIITEGDIRRAILGGLDLKDSSSTIANKDFKYLNKNYSKQEAINLFKDPFITHLPVLNNGKVIDIVPRESCSEVVSSKISVREMSEFPTVIMAGGKGTRLDPFTRVLPKPLIPVGNAPVITIIMEEFAKFGVNNFIISLNDKAKMVKAYFHDHEADYSIRYVEETNFLGTAGALGFLKSKIKTPFFVSNCDVILRTDYSALYEFHKMGGYNLTLVGSIQHHTVPYGVCKISDGGILTSLKEKPEFDFLVNTGFYLLDPEVLRFIPKNKYCDMPDLIKRIQREEMAVGVYPVAKSAWFDVGQWVDYKKTVSNYYENDIGV
jgi:dTDP-glucose pyrophosphorylase